MKLALLAVLLPLAACAPEIPFLLLPPTAPIWLKWQVVAGSQYRVLVSDNNKAWALHSTTYSFHKTNWTEWEVKVPMPTNAFLRVVSP